MKKLAITAAALAFASSSMTIQVSAADYDLLPPAPSFQPTWQGFYFGAHVGHGEAKFKRDAEVIRDFDDERPSELVRLRRSLSPDGLLGGVQAGYNWQYGSLVFGIEGDFSATDWGKSSIFFDEEFTHEIHLDEETITATTSVIAKTSAKVDFLASVRGRLGMAFDGLLIYGTGGVAFADAMVRDRIDIGAETHRRSKSFSDVGLVVGGGVAWMVIPHTFSLGVEGLYYAFNDKRKMYDETFVVGDELVTVRAKSEFEDAWAFRVRGDVHF
jgi:outer membrane immunogenic protein